MATTVFTPCSPIPTRVRAHVRTNTRLSNFCTLSRGAIRRVPILKFEAQKGERNSNSDMNVKDDEEKEAVKSLVERIIDSVHRTAGKSPRKKRTATRFDPKEKVSELFGDSNSDLSDDFSNLFVKSTKNDDEKNDVFSSKSVSKVDNGSSKPSSYFDNIIKDNDKIDNNASKKDFKPSRPPSKFVRRSPIPQYISIPEPSTLYFQEKKTVPLEDQEDQEEPIHMVFGEESSENVPTEEVEERLRMELHDKLNKLRVQQLKKVCKERGLKNYSYLTKAELVKLLMDSQV